MDDRAVSRAMAREAVQSGSPTSWFEPFYLRAQHGEGAIPWDDRKVNPNLATWAGFDPARCRSALVVGCGYGDDAEWLAAQGCRVTAFDIAPAAIAEARRRFPESSVDYQVANLLDPPRQWLQERFDLVVDIYTIQVLPWGSAERALALDQLAALTGRVLLIIARGRGEEDDHGSMPWPLTAAELETLSSEGGLTQSTFEDYLDGEDPPVRRFRACYLRNGK